MMRYLLNESPAASSIDAVIAFAYASGRYSAFKEGYAAGHDEARREFLSFQRSASTSAIGSLENSMGLTTISDRYDTADVFSRERTLPTLEQELPSEARKPSILVRVKHFQEDKAVCKARYRGRWFPVLLDGSSLEELDLRVDDLFEWVPRHDGVVRSDDVVRHPRKISDREMQAARDTFERLRQHLGSES